MGNYKKLDSADITYIKEIVKDEERVLTGDLSMKSTVMMNWVEQAAIRMW